MNIGLRARQWRDWVPIPTSDGRLDLRRWLLLEAHRLAVTGALLTLVFGTLMAVSMIWTIEMQTVLTETSTIQTLLNTFLSGMILLVSIVVSINSIVLSHDITTVEAQADRIQGAISFRRDIGELTPTGESPSDPSSFLTLMARVIDERAEEFTGELHGVEPDLADEIRAYGALLQDATDQLGDHDATGAQFAVLWKGVRFEYGPYLDRARRLKSLSEDSSTERLQAQFDALITAFELFATGREYFKTLYYTQEMSQLSRTLLAVALPAILFNASTILAIDGGILPRMWLFGLPPLQTFVAAAFTISLAPYIVLTSYMIRLSTVAWKTSSGGIFTLD